MKRHIILDDRGSTFVFRTSINPETPASGEFFSLLHRSSAMQIIQVTLLVGALLGVAMFFINGLKADPVSKLGAGCWIIPLLAVCVLQIRHLTTKAVDREELRAMIAAAKQSAHCPACGYNLRNLTPAPDHCTLCPECGAAWRLPSPNDTPPSPPA